MPHETDLIDIVAVGLGCAFVLGWIANRLKLSPLVGYLVAGIVVGPYTPGFVGDQEIANQLAEIGVMLLMFGVGLHFSLKDLMQVKSIAIPGALLQITVATVLGWGLAILMDWSHLHGIVFGFSLATASTVVLLRAMEDRRLLETTRGKIAVGWLIVEDIVCVFALVLMPVVAQVFVRESGTPPPTFGAVVATIVWTLLKVAAFLALMLLIGRRFIPWMLERIAGLGLRELFTLSVLSIALGVAYGSAKLFGVSFALGAFFAGMMLNESELSHKAADDSLPLRDAFAVLFFVSVGMLFDPSILIERPREVLATVFIIVLGKSVASYAIVRAFGYPNSTALTISASLAQIGEFAFIIAGLAVALNLLSPPERDLVLAGALITIMLNPLIFRINDRAMRKAKQAAGEIGPAGDAPIQPALPLQKHAVVVGYGRVGRQLTKLLRARGVPVAVVEEDGEFANSARAVGFPTVRGNIASEAVRREAAVDHASMAVFAMSNTFEAGYAIAQMKLGNPQLTVLARAHSDTEVRHLLDRGADGTVLAEHELAFSLAEMVMATPPYRRKPASAPAMPQAEQAPSAAP